MPKINGTSTSAFGVGRRESHDSDPFYARFSPPNLSADSTVNECSAANALFHGDARSMADVEENSVALVVTSPPYFAGKEYEQALGEGHIPATYVEYLDMLTDVFSECLRVLEPGGRIAVNVANLGRKPYRSLAGDVAGILQHRLKMLLRGEIVWVKAGGASGSCAWGSFRSASNPVLRDISERIVIGCKGRFDRAIRKAERKKQGLPHKDTISKEEFMEATLDVWHIRPESAKRVGHPAPFPVALPERIIKLYTYENDVVLDPFLGSGSTAIAAANQSRRFIGYDTDKDYISIATERIRAECGGFTDFRVAPVL